MKRAALFISIIAIVLSAVWFYFEKGFEPLITAVLGVAGVIGSVFIKPSQPQANSLSRQFDVIKARWFAQSKLKPASLDDARWILSEALDFLQQLRAEANTDPYHSEIENLIYAVKTVHNTGTRFDGGITYNKFWKDGTSSIEKLSEITNKI